MVKVRRVSRRATTIGAVSIALLAVTISSGGVSAAEQQTPPGESGAASSAVVSASGVDPNTPTPDQLARIAAQAPLVTAANRIKSVASKHAAGFTGLALEGTGVVLYWKGSVPADVSAEIGVVKATVPLTVRPAAFSRTELLAAADDVANATNGSNDRGFHSVKIPVDGRGLILVTEFGKGDKLAKAKPRTKVPAEVEEAAIPTELSGASRVTPTGVPDSPQGTGRVIRGGSQLIYPDPATGKAMTCTAGFGMVVGGQSAVLTAGHCNAGSFFDGSGQPVGTVRNTNLGHDELLINPSSVPVEASISDGGGLFFNESRPMAANWKLVVPNVNVFPGEELCQSGAQSGTLCGLVVQDNMTRQLCDGHGICSFTSLVDVLRQGGIAGRHGDSGGPIYRPWTMQIRSNNGYGRCVDINTTNLKQTYLFTCNRTPAQQWIYGWDQTLRPAANFNKCLDADSGTIGGNATIVQAMDCNGSINQKWTPNVAFAEFNNAPNNVQFKSNASSRCLDADTGTQTVDFTKLSLWDCTGTGPQRFTTQAEVQPKGIVSSSLGTEFRSAQNANFCLDAASDQPVNGGKVQMWTCNGAPQQKWMVDAYGHLQNAWSGLCLDADKPSLDGVPPRLPQRDGVQLHQWDCTALAKNQLWKTSNGATMALVLADPYGVCLDANPTGMANGSEVRTWSCNGSAPQSWKASQLLYMQDIGQAYLDFAGAVVKAG